METPAPEDGADTGLRWPEFDAGDEPFGCCPALSSATERIEGAPDTAAYGRGWGGMRGVDGREEDDDEDEEEADAPPAAAAADKETAEEVPDAIREATARVGWDECAAVSAAAEECWSERPPAV